ncbi:MAG: hypothetical protein H6799_00515 [Candidatus Nomurabacteria bacterium]|nr:MAG: hypothetical protein H6799_00515 [Candidatus Nomurabacteria bacterium]HRV76221.1 hypothetical protein [Candidatus Saccharimonadales bacterium]
MALRGFYNDNLSIPGRSSSGPELARDISFILKKGGAVRSVYDSIETSRPIGDMQGTPGIELAGKVATTVYAVLLPNPLASQKAFDRAQHFVSKYDLLEDYTN